MSKIITPQQGESIPFCFDRGGNDITGWVCTIFVKQYPDDVATITRIIPPGVNADGDPAWPGFLTQTETNLLDHGLWYISAKLVNASNDEEEAIPVRFNVTKAWA